MRYIVVWYDGRYDTQKQSKHFTRLGAYKKLIRAMREARICIDKYCGYVMDDKTGEVLIYMSR